MIDAWKVALDKGKRRNLRDGGNRPLQGQRDCNIDELWFAGPTAGVHVDEKVCTVETRELRKYFYCLALEVLALTVVSSS